MSSGVFTRWQITVSTLAEDACGLLLVAHPGDDLRGEDQARVEPACLLDPCGHPGAFGER